MPATSENIVQSGRKTVGDLNRLVQKNTCEFLRQQISWTEGQLTEFYREVVEASKAIDDADEVADLWKNAEAVCHDVLQVFIKACGEYPECPTELSKLFDIKMACHDQEEFHRCN